MARLKRFAPLLLLLAGAVAIFASGAGQYLNLDALQSHEAALRAFVAQQLPLALLAFIAVYALATAVSLPGGTILTLAGGFLFGTALRALLPGAGLENHPVQRFQFPSAGNQLPGEPVEQFGLIRQGAGLAKVIRRQHKSGAEMMLPETIHNHPRKQKSGTVIDIRDPVRQRATAA